MNKDVGGTEEGIEEPYGQLCNSVSAKAIAAADKKKRFIQRTVTTGDSFSDIFTFVQYDFISIFIIELMRFLPFLSLLSCFLSFREES